MKTLPFISTIGLMSVLALSLNSCSKENVVTKEEPTTVSVMAGDPAETMYQVNIQAGKFDPETLYALPGHKVTWKNIDGVVHSVVSDDGRTFNSGNLNTGATFSFMTSETVVYPYHCGVHPNERGVLSVVTR